LILKPAKETREEISAASPLSELACGHHIEDSVVVNGKGASSMLVFLQRNKRIIKLLDAAHIKCLSTYVRFFLLALPNATGRRLDAGRRLSKYGCAWIVSPCIKDIDDIAKVTERSKLP